MTTKQTTRTPARATPNKRTAAKPKTDASDAIAFLMTQHREVEALFKQFEKLGEDGPSDEKETIVREACDKLTIHARIEEEIFYPAAREVPEVDALLNEAEVEHGTAKDLISTLEAMEADDDMFDANFTVLSEYIKHHVKEEEGELFPQVKKGGLELDQLGRELAARADELATMPEPA